MGSLNKVILLGRATRDPEVRTFGGGGKVANFGFAVDNRKKDSATGEWVKDPCFLDCKAFSGQYSKLADTVENYVRKGKEVVIEGHLVMETWEDKNGGGKRSNLVVVVDNVQFVGPKDADAPAAPRQPPAPPPGGGYDDWDNTPADNPF